MPMKWNTANGSIGTLKHCQSFWFVDNRKHPCFYYCKGTCFNYVRNFWACLPPVLCALNTQYYLPPPLFPIICAHFCNFFPKVCKTTAFWCHQCFSLRKAVKPDKKICKPTYCHPIYAMQSLLLLVLLLAKAKCSPAGVGEIEATVIFC